ncbi:MAG: ABC transporter ATP-binding protein [Lachnospiraceae bacterium]|nr:ABC transporter ATP-binding protein [Lachnospiraceae bacterium]
MAEPILKIENLKANYGSIVAIKGIDLEVFEGEIVTIIGANGAGKTTLLSCISGLMPYEGSITYKGEKLGGKIDSAAIVERGIVQIPEGRQIFSDLSVFENLKMGAYTRKKGDDIEKDIREVYDLFPRLEERKDQKGGSLSGGEQQMLAMGRAMMAKPRLLLMDEPSMGLAPVVVNDIFATIRHLNKELGVTIVLNEQNARLALKTADRAYVMETGLIQLSGDAKEMAQDPEVQKLYLGG